MIWSDYGYLLEKNKFGENSMIYQFFTENHGKISGIIHKDIISAKDMEKMIQQLLKKNNYDMIFMAAAVADYKPEIYSLEKIKSHEKNVNLKLNQTTDILKNIKSPKSLKVGFALETSNGEKNAKSKLESKNLDYIILNYANEENAGFDSNTNHLFLYSKEGYKKEFNLDTKYRLSLDLIKTIIKNEKNK